MAAFGILQEHRDREHGAQPVDAPITLPHGRKLPMEIKHGDWDNHVPETATWAMRAKPEGGYWLFLSCPLCSKIALLSEHSVTDDGEVTPSVVCPRDGCTFHEFVTLVGWKA